MSSTQNENEVYRRIKLLGEGSFGKAYLVECIQDKSLCVIKQVDLTQMREEERKETIKEARILEALRHPNIVRFREVYKTKKGRLCIVMDYADGGDLGHRIKQTGSFHFSETQILDWFTQICLSIKHVHDRKIIHRDLKTQNIFLTMEGVIKLGDFGIARVLNHTREKCKTIVGTPYYLSPEIIESKDYSFKTDIWSLGVILYELCALKPPFNAESLHGLALKIVRGQYNPIPDRYSPSVKNLIANLLQVDPIRRPNIHEVLKTPIIVSRIKSVLSESIRNVEFSHTILHKQNFVNNNLQVPFDNEIRNVHSQPNLSKQAQISPQNYLLALNNQKQQPLTQLQKQRQVYQQHQPTVLYELIQNYEYFSKQYPPYQNRYAQKQPLQPQRQNISPIQREENNKSPMMANNNKSPMQRDKSPFEIQREQVRQQIKKNEERVQQLQENRQRYLQQEREVPKLSREPYSQPHLYQPTSARSAQQQQIKLEPIRVEPIRVEPIRVSIEVNKVEQKQDLPRIEVPKLEIKDRAPPRQMKESQQILQEINQFKSEPSRQIDYKRQNSNREEKQEKQIVSERVIHEKPIIEKPIISERMPLEKLNEKLQQINLSKVEEEQVIVVEDIDDASQLLQELEDIVINAEVGIKQSQVVDLPEIDLINMRQEIDREDDESLDEDEEDQRAEFLEDEASKPKELLYQIIIKQFGKQHAEQYLQKLSNLHRQEYINFITNDETPGKEMLILYECM